MILLDAIVSGPSLDDQMIEALYDRAEGLPEALELIGLPVTLEEYEAFLEEYEREPYNSAVDNKLLDVKFGLLGNSGITEPRKGRHKGVLFEPAVTIPLSDPIGKEQGLEGGVYEWLREELGEILVEMGENEVDIDSLLGKLEAWTNNKEGDRSIGSVVLPNVMMSILTQYKIKLRTVPAKTPTLNGIDYNTFEFDYEIDHTSRKSDPALHRKQFIISALITAMTDNAKLRLAAKLGLKRKALPTVVTMLGLGVDLKTAVLMVNFPSIKEALFHGENKDEITDSGFVKLLEKRKKQIETTLKEYYKQAKIDKKLPAIEVNIENLKSGIESIRFDRNIDYEMYGMEDVFKPTISIEQMSLELSVLDQFINFISITETLRNATTLLELQKGFGRDLNALDFKQESAEKLGLLHTAKQFKDSKIPVDLRPIFINKNNMYSASYKIFREMYDDLSPLVLLKRTPKFIELKSKVLANLTKSPFKMGEQQKKEVSRDLLNYLTIKAYRETLTKDKFAGKSIESLSNSMIYDGKLKLANKQKAYKNIDEDALSIRTVVERLKARVDDFDKSNYFLHTFTRLIEAEHEDNKSGTMKLESNTWTQFSDSELVRVQNSILELLTMDSGEGEMYDDVMHLVHYLAVMDGMSFGTGSFINVIPPVLTKDLLNSVDKVHEIFLDTKEREGAHKAVFGMNFDDMTDEFIRGYLKSKGSAFFLTGIKVSDIIKDQNTEPIPEEDIGKSAESMTVDYDLMEDAGNSKMLSNIAYRPFYYGAGNNRKQYGSVMHAFQVLKSGEFDKATDKKYKKGSKKDELMNAEGKRIVGRKKKTDQAKDPAYLLASIVEESILQNLNLENSDLTLLGQILMHAKKFEFPTNDMISRATEKGILKARANMVYVELTEKDKEVPNPSRTFENIRKVTTTIATNRKYEKTSKLLINIPEKTLSIDIFKGIAAKFVEKIKTAKKKNTKEADKIVSKLIKAGFSVRWITVKRGKTTSVIPQIEFPVVIYANKKYYELTTVHRDKAYPKGGNLNNIIPGDSDIAYGNKAEYKEVELEGSSRQTKIGFMFGPRPTHNDIVDYGKDKKRAFGDEEIKITEQDEQSADDANKFFGIGVDREEGDVIVEEEEYQEEEEMYEGLQVESNVNKLELSDEDKLKDWYNSLTLEQQTKLATNEDIQITSAKDVVSLMKTGSLEMVGFLPTSEDIIELLEKCYI